MSAPSHKHQRQRPPWLALLGLVILPALFLLTVNWRVALNGDILELLPRSGDTPQAVAARGMLNERLSHPVMLRASATGITRAELVAAFREAARQPAFGEPFIIGENDFQRTLLPVLKQHRETLFAANWLDRMRSEYARRSDDPDFIEWAARESARNLNEFLEQPESMAYADEIPADPLLLLPGAMETLPPPPTPPDDGLIAWIPVKVDPLSTKGQTAIVQSLNALESAMNTVAPGYEQTAAGVYDLAMASESRTKHEVGWLNIQMAGAILILLLVLARRPGFLLLTIVPLLVACLWCVTGGLLVFGHIHVIALAVSSVVLGLSVDYAVHLCALRGDGSLRDAWRRVRLPLATSCVSTCFGFLFLLLSPMAALRQVGVMAPAGLIGSLLAVRWLLPWLEPIAGTFRLRPFLEKPAPALPRKVWMPVALIAWMAAGAVLNWSQPFADDIRDYQAPIDESLERYRDLAESMNHADAGERWYCFAASPMGLMERLRKVRETTEAKDMLLPVSQAGQWSNFATRSNHFAEALRQSLRQEGFRPESFEPFFTKLRSANEWDSPKAMSAALKDLAEALPGPLQALIMTDGAVWVAVFDAPPRASIPVELQAFTSELAQQKSLNRALARAREGILRSAGWGLLGMAACVLVLFRRRGIAALALPTWSVPLGLAGTIVLGDSLGLLAVIGAILAFCLALDYGAFATCSTAPPASIRISAATTSCAFMILSFCSLPAVAQLGQVVALSVLFAWLGAELLCLPPPKINAQSKVP